MEDSGYYNHFVHFRAHILLAWQALVRGHVPALTHAHSNCFVKQADPQKVDSTV